MPHQSPSQYLIKNHKSNPVKLINSLPCVSHLLSLFCLSVCLSHTHTHSHTQTHTVFVILKLWLGLLWLFWEIEVIIRLGILGVWWGHWEDLWWRALLTLAMGRRLTTPPARPPPPPPPPGRWKVAPRSRRRPPPRRPLSALPPRWMTCSRSSTAPIQCASSSVASTMNSEVRFPCSSFSLSLSLKFWISDFRWMHNSMQMRGDFNFEVHKTSTSFLGIFFPRQL